MPQLRLTLFCFALLGPLMAVGAEGTNPLLEAAQQEASRALALNHSPRAAAHLIRLHAFKDDLEDLSLLTRAYAPFLKDREVDPAVRDLARILMLDVEKARGRLPKATELNHQLGFVHDFYVVGGFDNEGKAGCAKDFGPERTVDVKATYPAKRHDVTWHKLGVVPFDGYIDLASAIRPNRDTVAYALTFLEAAEDVQVGLSLGASGAHKLWVNGQLASSQERYNLARPDQSRLSVRLRKGINPVLLKVCESGGPFGFYLRTEGRVQAVLPATPPAMTKGTFPKAKRLPNVSELLAQAVKRNPKDAALRGEYATVLQFLRTFDASENVARLEAERAAAEAPKDARLQLLAAELQDEDANVRRQYLQAAYEVSSSDPLVRLALAQFELGRNHADRALALATALVTDYPKFTSASLLLARVYDDLGEQVKAADQAERTLLEHPSSAPAAREAARFARRLDRPALALERLRLALALRFDHLGTRSTLADALADLSRVDEAAFEWTEILKLEPFDNASRLKYAELLAANGRATLADQVFSQAMDLAPDDPEVFEHHGRALLESGRRAPAIAAFERALALRPQNPPLREALRALKGENTVPALQYVFDVKTLVSEADALQGEDAVYLTDYSYNRVQPSGLSSQFHQLAVKVYTPRGVEAFRSFPITYSPDRQEVRVLKARITKADGSVVESYGDADRNLNEPWSAMYYDARAKVLSFPALGPGDILELQYRLEDTAQENLLSDYWGDVDYVQGTHPKIRYQYMVEMPASRPLYWNKADKVQGLTFARSPLGEDRVLFRWNAERVSKVIPEPAMPGWSEVASTLHVSTYETWNQVGQYYWSLVRDQLTPNAELRKTVNTVLANVDRKDELAVVRAIYDFVVTHTRYVALEFGIHGYKPYRVDQVLSRRFGDCKDKASLIHAMLKVAGVESQLVLLRMRQLGNIGQEPASLAAFNHAIAFVPKLNLFLDGTAEFHNSRELPSADRLANVLLVGADGNSKFLTIPEATASDNVTQLDLDVAFKPDGSAEVKGHSTVSGQSAPEYRRAYQSAASRKATFEQGWAQTFPGLRVQEVTLKTAGNLDADVSMAYKMLVPRYAEALPNTLRFHPFGGSRTYTQMLAPLAERKLDVVLQSPWLHKFSFRYRLPPHYVARALPPTLDETSPFGHLKMNFRQEADGTVVCQGEMALSVTRIKAADYAHFRAFLSQVDQAFSRKLVVSGPTAETANKN